MKIVCIIPARYASGRLPGKPLLSISGRPLLERTYRQACKAGLAGVYIATDDKRIGELATAIGAPCLMTDPALPSGTDRCAAALAQLDHQVDGIINVQGDEPFIEPGHILAVASLLRQGAPIATLACPIRLQDQLTDPACVKLVRSEGGRGLYFSRYPIPYLRSAAGAAEVSSHRYLRHLGIYGFATDTLAELVKLPINDLEAAESLEQLRWLANDYPIEVGLVEHAGIGIDTPADLLAAEAWLATQPAGLYD